jgi:hypothetical protein
MVDSLIFHFSDQYPLHLRFGRCASWQLAGSHAFCAAAFASVEQNPEAALSSTLSRDSSYHRCAFCNVKKRKPVQHFAQYFEACGDFQRATAHLRVYFEQRIRGATGAEESFRIVHPARAGRWRACRPTLLNQHIVNAFEWS